MAFTIKLKKDESIERHKSCLVAWGVGQQYGINYNKNFAPTVMMDTLRLFLAMVASYDLECRDFDMKIAFTKSVIWEIINL